MAIVQSSQAHEVSGHRHDLRRVECIVAGIQRIYAFLFVLLGLALVVLLAIRGPGRFSSGQWLCIGVTFETIAVTYVGLRLRKPWVVSLMVFGSAYTMIPCAAGRPDTLVAVIASRAWALFALYQLWFFTRPNTEKFFGTNGVTVF